MKITILQGAFLPVPPRRGGAVEKMWFELGAEFAARGHEVVHVSRRCDGLSDTEMLRGVSHLRVGGFDQPASAPLLKYFDLRYSLRACRIAPRADVVVTNTFWSPLLLPRNRGAVCVDVQRMPKGQISLYRRARRLRANSSAVAAAIAQQAPAMAAKVRIIPNPLPFVPTHRVNWGEKEKTVLFAGRLHPEKGLPLLLEAWAQRRPQDSLAGWKLEIVGPSAVEHGGAGEEWVRSLRQRFPDPDIVWRGAVFDTAELNRRYERAAVFVYPSLARRGETFGLAILEAMAWGAIPVVSNLDCFRDFVSAGKNGLICDCEEPNAASHLIETIGLAASDNSSRLAREAVAVRETHSVAAIATQFLQDFSTFP